MKNTHRKHTAMLMSAVLLMAGTAVLPQSTAVNSVSLTAYAAEADYPWSTYLKKDASWFGSSEAITVADACIQYQVSGEGGWQKGMATAHTGDWAHSTIDNDATTSQIRFLMRTYAQTKQQKYLDCAMRGVDCLFKMQYANGGYMQCLNTPGTYHAHITLNDGAYIHVLQIMDEMSRKAGDFTAVSDSYAQKAGQSLQKGIQCLLDMQISGAAWCQQHDENTLKPAGARAYELPSTCTSESAGVITFLYQYAKDHPERSDIAKAVNTAIKWFQKVTLTGIKFVSQGDDKVVVQDANADPLWARFYELGTDRPLFSDRDSSVHYDVAEISKERRTGYSWYGNWGKNVVKLALLPEDSTPVQEPEYSGQLISKLVVHDLANGANWSVQQKLGVGSKIFGDRDFTVTTLPGWLEGAEYVQAACDSKNTNSDLAELTAAQDLTAAVIVDMRLIEEQGIMPPWLSGWQQSSDVLSISNTVVFEIFTKDLKAGESVTLGSNMTNQNVVNYFAAVLPAAAQTTTAVTTTTTTVTTTTTTETAETTSFSHPTGTRETETETTTFSHPTGTRETETETTTFSHPTGTRETTTVSTTVSTHSDAGRLPGDVNVDGTVDVKDAVLLSRVIGGDTTASLEETGRRNADCDGEEGISPADLTMLIRYLARLIPELSA